LLRRIGALLTRRTKLYEIDRSKDFLSGLGQRLTQSIPSSIDFTGHSQKPAISSFVSVKSPSITVLFAPLPFFV